jgi:hypothetical protein
MEDQIDIKSAAAVIKRNRAVLRSREYFEGIKTQTRTVDKKFSKGYAYRLFFTVPSVNDRSQQRLISEEIKNATESLAGKFKLMVPSDAKIRFDSIFLDEESDIQILILILGRRAISKIFKFE